VREWANIPAEAAAPNKVAALASRGHQPMPARGTKKGVRMDPNEQKRRQDEAKRRNWQKRRHMKTERQRARIHRNLARESKLTPADFLADAAINGMSLTVARNLDRPKLKFIDAHGRVHLEENLSAEELIQRHTKAGQP
jgi:hypothetical protein